MSDSQSYRIAKKPRHESEKDMSSRERLEEVFAGRRPDRTPMLGGWIACPEHICQLAGVDLDTYWNDPISVSIAVYEKLGTDGLMGIYVPRRRGDFRAVDESSYRKADKGISLEEAIAQIEAMPSAAEVESEFDFQKEYAKFRSGLIDMQERCGDMLWMPAQFKASARACWYKQFGYETFFSMVGLYPQHISRLMEIGGARSRCQSRVIASAVREGLYPKACLLGEDICTQRGPMVSPDFLAEHWAPALRYGLQPLLDVGCRPVWHCDGDVRLILDLLLDCGIQGLQGFQPECGLTIDLVASKRTREGKPLLIFGPLSVTTELPSCFPNEVRAKVQHAIKVCSGQADLVLFTANTINPDVPLENILAMYEAVRESH